MTKEYDSLLSVTNRKYWYTVTTYTCPECGKVRRYKERNENRPIKIERTTRCYGCSDL